MAKSRADPKGGAMDARNTPFRIHKHREPVKPASTVEGEEVGETTVRVFLWRKKSSLCRFIRGAN